MASTKLMDTVKLPRPSMNYMVVGGICMVALTGTSMMVENIHSDVQPLHK